jgi:hypothetical protein
MIPPQGFRVGISVPDSERCRLVAERVAYHSQTGVLHAAASKETQYKLQYQRVFLDLLRGTHKGPDTVTGLVEKFVRLAESLRISHAIAVPFRDDDNVLATKWADVLRNTRFFDETILGSSA